MHTLTGLLLPHDPFASRSDLSRKLYLHAQRLLTGLLSCVSMPSCCLCEKIFAHFTCPQLMGRPHALILRPAGGTPGQTLCPEYANCPGQRVSPWPGRCGPRGAGAKPSVRGLLDTQGLRERGLARAARAGPVNANSPSHPQNSKFRCLSLPKRRVETGTSLFEGRPGELIFFKIPFLPCFYLNSGLARM